MRWTAIVPIRPSAQGKTRLSGALTAEERKRLIEQLFVHVMDTLQSVSMIMDVVALSESRPNRWQGRWLMDKGHGLNSELQAAAASFGNSALLVAHADLPLLSKLDIEALLAAAEADCAIAPDRHGTGTNALALGHGAADFRFTFGPGSFSRHVAAAQGRAQIVRRTGLSLDIDTPVDLAAAAMAGFRFGRLI